MLHSFLKKTLFPMPFVYFAHYLNPLLKHYQIALFPPKYQIYPEYLIHLIKSKFDLRYPFSKLTIKYNQSIKSSISNSNFSATTATQYLLKEIIDNFFWYHICWKLSRKELSGQFAGEKLCKCKTAVFGELKPPWEKNIKIVSEKNSQFT